MHIALLSAEYPPQPGGVGDYTRCLALSLSKRGHTLSVITGSADTARTTEETDAQPGVVVLHRTVSSWGWRCWRDISSTLTLLHPDVLHIQYQTGAYEMHPAINLLPWRLRAHSPRPLLAVTFHDLLEPYLFPKAGKLRHWITQRLAHDTDRVVVTNNEDAAAVQAVATPHLIPIGSNIAVAPPPDYHREAWRARLGVSPSTFLIAYFGLLSHAKGVDLLLDALTHLVGEERSSSEQASPSPFALLLIGGSASATHDRAYADALRARLEQSSTHNHTIITGHVDEPTVSAHLLASDCVALPFRGGASFRSGSLLAALAHGAAVVTTPPTFSAPPPAPRLVHGENAWLAARGESTALAEALRALANNGSLRAQLGQGARALSAHFRWEKIAHQHELVYKEGTMKEANQKSEMSR